MVCSTFPFMRSAGMTHNNFFRSISPLVAPRVSDSLHAQQNLQAKENHSTVIEQGFRSALFVGVLVLFWFVVASYLTGKSDLIIRSLSDLTRGNLDQARTDEVLAISRQQTIFGEVGRSIVAFHEALAANAKAQRAIQEERHRLRTIIDAMPDLVALKDGEGRYLDCNPRYESLFGVPLADILGKRNIDFLPPELLEAAQVSEAEAARTGLVSRFSAWHTFASDGQPMLPKADIFSFTTRFAWIEGSRNRLCPRAGAPRTDSGATLTPAPSCP